MDHLRLINSQGVLTVYISGILNGFLILRNYKSFISHELQQKHFAEKYSKISTFEQHKV